MSEATARDDQERDWEGELPAPVRPVGNALPDWKVARIVALRREGLTYVVIAERLGIHLVTAWWYSRAAGLVTPRVCTRCGSSIPGRRAQGQPEPLCLECRHEARRQAGRGATVARRRS